MKKIEPYILALGFVFIVLVEDPHTKDMRYIRHFLWGGLVTILFLLIVHRSARWHNVDWNVVTRKIFPIFAGYMIVSVFSLFRAINPSEGVYQILKNFVWAVFIIELVLIDKKPLISCLVILSILLGILGIWQYFNIEVISYRAGTLGSKNLFSSALALLLPFSIYTLFKSKWKIFSLISIGLILFNIITLQSRAVWLSLAVTAFYVLYYKKCLIIGICLAVIVSVLLYNYLPENQLNRYTNYRSIVNRSQLWYSSWEMFKDNPMGVGIGNWPIVIGKYSKNIIMPDGGKTGKEVLWQRPHNLPLQVLSETGFLGLILYAGVFICALYYSRNSPVAFSGILIFIVISCFSFIDERVAHPMLLAVYISIALGSYLHLSTNYKLYKLQSLFIMTILLLVLGCVDFWHRYDTARMAVRIDNQRKAGNFKDNIYELHGFPSWFATVNRIGVPITHYWGEWFYYRRDYKTALEYYKRSEKYNPYSLYVLNNIGGTYLILGEKEKAIEYLTRALEISPTLAVAQRNMKIAKGL